MCCEATATGKPLQIFTGNNWLTPKHLHFVTSLIESNHASLLATQKQTQLKANELNVAKDIATAIAKL